MSPFSKIEDSKTHVIEKKTKEILLNFKKKAVHPLKWRLSKANISNSFDIIALINALDLGDENNRLTVHTRAIKINALKFQSD